MTRSHEIDITFPTWKYYEPEQHIDYTNTFFTLSTGGNIMFVGHAATIDMMVIALKRIGSAPAAACPYQINPHLLRVPYCALAAMRGAGLAWRLAGPPCPPSINSSSGRFDWKILADLL